ncbi:hypothetical protein Tco_1186870 [Tanacetum coccineum]
MKTLIHHLQSSLKKIVSSSEEPIANEPTTEVSDDNVDESVQEDTRELDGNTFINPFCTPIQILRIPRLSRSLPDFEEYVVSTSVDTPYMILWSTIK